MRKEFNKIEKKKAYKVGNTEKNQKEIKMSDSQGNLRKSCSIKNIKIKYYKRKLKEKNENQIPQLFLNLNEKSLCNFPISPRFHSLSLLNILSEGNIKKNNSNNNNSQNKMNIGNININRFNNNPPSKKPCAIKSLALMISPINFNESLARKNNNIIKNKNKDNNKFYNKTSLNTADTKSSNEETEENEKIRIPKKTQNKIIFHKKIREKHPVKKEIPRKIESIIKNNLISQAEELIKSQRNNSPKNFETTRNDLFNNDSNNFSNTTPLQNKMKMFLRKDKKTITKIVKEEDQLTLDDSPLDIPNSKIPLFVSKLIPTGLFSQLKNNFELKKFILSYLDPKSLLKISKNITHEFDSFIKLKICDFFIHKILYDKDREEFKSFIKKSVFKYSSIPIYDLQNIYVDNLYESSNSNKKYLEDIEKDLTRTFPLDETFKKGKENLKKLSHLLTAYANFNRKIGYAQGLNFLVGNCIFLFNTEKEVFIFVDGMINKFNLINLYGVSNDLKRKVDLIGMQIKKALPELCHFFEYNLLNHEFFTANWVLTLFSCHMNREHLFIVWDFMIVFGWKFFDNFIIEVLQKYWKKIISCEPAKLSSLMKNLFKSPDFAQDFNNIVTCTMDKMKQI